MSDGTRFNPLWIWLDPEGLSYDIKQGKIPEVCGINTCFKKIIFWYEHIVDIIVVLADLIYPWTLLWRVFTQNAQQDISPITLITQMNGRRVVPETEMARTPARIPSRRFSLLASLRRNNFIHEQNGDYYCFHAHYNKTQLSNHNDDFQRFTRALVWYQVKT